MYALTGGHSGVRLFSQYCLDVSPQCCILWIFIIIDFCLFLDLIAVADDISICRARHRCPKIVGHFCTEILQLFDVGEQCSCETHADVLISEGKTQNVL